MDKQQALPHRNAEKLFATSLAFNVHPGISNAALEYTISVIKSVLAECVR